MDKGWIKFYRKVHDSNMYKSLNSTQRDVMMQLLLLANHSDNNWEWEGEIYECKPGQFITSLDSIKRCCAKNVTTQNIRTALLKLEKWHFLTNKSTKKGRLITICNWRIYQGDDKETNKDINSQLTNSQQTANKQLTTNKNDKELKNVEEKDINISFENFWNIYDKKVGSKIKLEKKWIKLSDDERMNAINHIVEYKIAQPNKQYRKNPETYINNKSWNDEIITSTDNDNGKIRQNKPESLQERIEQFEKRHS